MVMAREASKDVVQICEEWYQRMWLVSAWQIYIEGPCSAWPRDTMGHGQHRNLKLYMAMNCAEYNIALDPYMQYKIHKW